MIYPKLVEAWETEGGKLVASHHEATKHQKKEEGKMREQKGIKLELRGAIKNGEKYYEITKISCLREEDLPEEYLLSPPCCYMADMDTLCVNFRTIIPEAQKGMRYVAGLRYSEETIERLIDNLHKCGGRLHEINAKLKKENDGWEGHKRTVII